MQEPGAAQKIQESDKVQDMQKGNYKVLLRQIETKISHDGKNTNKSAQVPFSKLISLATGE